MAGKRSKSSERWLRRQNRDYFARQAREQGQVSRAHFKLAELDKRYKLVRKNSRILELGAAPGGWTRYLEDKLSAQGRLLVVDTLEITTGAHTSVVTGLAGEAQTDAEIEQTLATWRAESVASDRVLDLVLSDMAPNMSGVRAVDQARSMELADVALGCCSKWLQSDGGFAIKMFQGEGLDDWVAALRKPFARVAMTKPKSSRPESREVFVVAQGYDPSQDDHSAFV